MNPIHSNRKLSFISRLTVCASLALCAAQGAVAATATAQGGATVVVPIEIAKVSDLSFGQFSAVGAGTISIATDGARAKTGGVVLLQGAQGNAASFDVTGHAGATYAITLPSSALSVTGPGAAMSMDGFVSDPAGTGVLSSGAQTIKVGATLHVATAQTDGAYSASLPVSVEYN